VDRHVLLIGATLLDTKGKPLHGLVEGTSNPARIRHTRGGSARNVAENLSRLGVDAKLLSAVGGDPTGARLLAQTAGAGVDIEHILRIRAENSGAYIALLDSDGSMWVALDDTSVMKHITPEYLRDNEQLFEGASAVMVDGSLTPDALATAISLARRHGVYICADPSSTRMASKLTPHLSELDLIVPNEAEAATLCEHEFAGHDPDESLEDALELCRAGIATVIVTLSDFGLVYATSDERGHIPARYSRMVDSTGTGDALTAAVLFGHINDLPLIESIRLGAAAASLTLQSADTVVPDLSLDMLYEHLIV